jgi:hypothetical protein
VSILFQEKRHPLPRRKHTTIAAYFPYKYKKKKLNYKNIAIAFLS